MHIVEIETPKHCNKCPFGHCVYSLPLESSSISSIDGKENKTGTYGYSCSVDYWNNGRYTKVARAECGKDIKKPEWCGLKEI